MFRIPVRMLPQRETKKRRSASSFDLHDSQVRLSVQLAEAGADIRTT